MSKWNKLFTYDANEGLILWIPNRPKRPSGSPAGNIKSDGRYTTLHATIDGEKKRYYAHRIIWEMHNGEIPNGMCIDHIDGNGLNNKIENLRIATLSENQRNSAIPKNNKFGIMGVYKRKKGFAVQIAGKHIGYVLDFFEACCLRKSAEVLLGYHKNHGRSAL